jgi:hypothetical protein
MKRFRGFAVGVSVFGALALPAVAQAGGAFHNAGSGLCMSSLGTKTNGDGAVQWGCNGSSNQFWVARGGLLEGYALWNSGDGKCLADHSGGAYDGNWEVMWSCSSDNGTPDWTQQFEIITDRYHQQYWQIETLNSGFGPTSYCLTSNGSNTQGSPIVIHSCNSALNQAWWEG